MTQVCFLGDPEINLRYELLSRETARNALQTYDLGTPFHNSVGIETVSLGAAVALTNDLNWYIVRFVADVLLREPSVSESEWLSRDLATAIRDDVVAPEESGRFLKIYGVAGDQGPVGGDGVSSSTADRDSPSESARGIDSPVAGDRPGGSDEGSAPDPASPRAAEEPPLLVEPMFVTRTGPTIPEYDLRAVDETLVVRVTEEEFGA